MSENRTTRIDKRGLRVRERKYSIDLIQTIGTRAARREIVLEPNPTHQKEPSQ